MIHVWQLCLIWKTRACGHDFWIPNIHKLRPFSTNFLFGPASRHGSRCWCQSPRTIIRPLAKINETPPGSTALKTKFSACLKANGWARRGPGAGVPGPLRSKSKQASWGCSVFECTWDYVWNGRTELCSESRELDAILYSFSLFWTVAEFHFSIWEGTLCSCRSLPVLREKESSRDTDPLCGASSLFSQAKVVLFNEVTIPRTFFFFFSEENPNSGPSVR